MYCTFRYERPTHCKLEKDSCERQEQFNIAHRKVKLTLVAFSVATYVGAEFGFVSFSSTMFQYMAPLHLSAKEAAHVQSIFSTFFTLGRLVTAFISLKLRPDLILLYHYFIQTFSVGLLFFGRDNITLIYIGNAISGYGYSAIWPAMFAFTEQYLKLTDRICSFFSFLAGTMALVIPLVLGQIFMSYPLILLFLIAGFVLTSFTLFVIVRVWICLDASISGSQLSAKMSDHNCIDQMKNPK